MQDFPPSRYFAKIAIDLLTGYNCQRGGYVCEGYAAKLLYPKPNMTEQSLALIQCKAQHAQTALDPLQPEDHMSQQPVGFQGESEKQKMLTGKLYRPYSQELQKERMRCSDPFCHNSMRTNPKECLRELCISLDSAARLSFTRIGKDVYVDPPFRCDYGYNIWIGNNVVIEANCFISDARGVTIGDGTLIGPNVTIMGKVYPYELESRKGGPMKAMARGFRIVIGKNVCIGANCVISPSEDHVQNGVLEIGVGAYITSGSTVVKVSLANCVC
jgi:acetyltransferase-like isoleucine patch superfamily enzyme